jgi:proteasome regulatory subunit
LDEELDQSISNEIVEKLELLERQNSELLEEVRRVEGEKRYVESELFRLQKEIKRMRSELERLKSPPLIIGSI